MKQFDIAGGYDSNKINEAAKHEFELRHEGADHREPDRVYQDHLAAIHVKIESKEAAKA